MKTITIMAKGPNGENACLHLKTNAKWIALDVRDQKKMKKFFPQEVFEISIGEDDSVKFIRQGCKIDFAYTMS